LKLLNFLFASLIFFSCSADFHVRQAQKKGMFIESDTIKKSIIIPYKVDSGKYNLELSRLFKDTFNIKTKSGIESKIKLSYNKENDSIFIDNYIYVPSDTIKVVEYINNKIVCPKTIGKIAFIGYLILTLIVGVLIEKMFKL
jgi:hypothetical protein